MRCRSTVVILLDVPRSRTLLRAVVLAAAAAALTLALTPGTASTPAAPPTALGPYALVDGPLDFFPPAVPRNVTAVGHDRSLTVSWEAVTAADLNDYRVYLDGVAVATVARPRTTTTITGLTNFRAYSVQVSARDGNPNESARSTAVTATPFDDVAPSPVTGLVATRGDGRVTLAWSPESTGESDRARVKVYADGALRATLPAATTTYDVTGLTNDVEHSFFLVAEDANPAAYGGPNASAPSVTVKATPTDLTAPSPPSALTGVRGDASAALTWQAPPDPDVATYLVLGDDGSVLATVAAPATTHVLAPLANGAPVGLRLIAVDAHGNRSSPSGRVSVTPQTPPAVISGLVADAPDDAVDLSWSAPTSAPGVADVARVQVWRAGSPDVLVATVPGGSTTYRVDGHLPGSVESFFVVALDADGRASAASATVTTVLGSPTAVRGTSGDTTATVVWSAVPGASGYRVERADGAGWVAAGTTAGTTLTVTGLTNLTQERFRVVAAAADGRESAPSAEVSVRIGYTPPTTVPTAGSGGAVGLAASRDGRYAVLPVRSGAATDLVRVDRLSTDRVTIASGIGADALGRSAVSADGRYVAVLTADGHDPDDTNRVPDVYRYDVASGAWSWVSAPLDRRARDASAVVPGLTPAALTTPDLGPTLAITGDGSRVFFLSARASLVARDAAGTLDLFVRDVDAGTTSRVTPATGPRPAGTGFAATPDGTHVLYAAAGSALVRQQVTGAGVVEVRAPQGAPLSPLGRAGQLAISDDGARVLAAAVLGSTTTVVQADLAGVPGTVTSPFPVVRSRVVTSADYGGGQLAISPDGAHAFAATREPLLAADRNGRVDVYRVDLSDVTRRVLVTAAPDGGPTAVPGEATNVNRLDELGAITALDADRVVLVTQRPLIDADANALRDAYAVDLAAAPAGRSHPLVGSP